MFALVDALTRTAAIKQHALIAVNHWRKCREGSSKESTRPEWIVVSDAVTHARGSTERAREVPAAQHNSTDRIEAICCLSHDEKSPNTPLPSVTFNAYGDCVAVFFGQFGANGITRNNRLRLHSQPA